MRRRYEAANLDGAVELLSQLYSRVRPQARGRDGGLTLEQHTMGSLTLSRATYDLTAGLAVEPLGSVVVARVRSGRLCHGTGENARESLRGDVYVPADPDAGYVVEIEEADCDVVVLDPELLADLAEPQPGSGDRVRLTGHRPVSPTAAARWTRTCAMVRDLATSTATPLPELAAGQAARLMAAVTLTTFPSNAVVQPSAEDSHDGHPATLRRAIAYIEANPDLDIGIGDIARAAYVTPRALQLAFRRHLDTTPLAYLRRVRLDHARRELQDGAHEGTTVTAVALRWGFDPGGFAKQYRAAFSELPSRTLES